MADSAITAEELATWLTPREALNRVYETFGDIGIAARAIDGRLKGGLIRAGANSSSWEGSGNPTSTVLIPASYWSHLSGVARSADWWDTGDVRFFFGRDPNHTKSRTGRFFGVRFEPSGVHALVADAPKKTATPSARLSESWRPPMSPPMSVERRRLVLASTSILKALGHAGFDRMLLELGVPEDVGAGSGLLARSTSLGRYVLTNPDAKAFDGALLSDALIRRAQDLFDRGFMSNLSQQDRAEYEQAAQNDQARPITVEPATAPSSGPAHIPLARPKERRKVFIVHGHDEGPRESVARFLEKLDFELVILHERPNKGRTIITKFQQEAADVGYAVVLMTPDDHGGKVGEKPTPRVRQNVVFELGFFIGVLGPEKVAALVKEDVERPSDFDGVVYISIDDSGWRLKLGKELEAAGFTVDWAKIA